MGHPDLLLTQTFLAGRYLWLSSLIRAFFNMHPVRVIIFDHTRLLLLLLPTHGHRPRRHTDHSDLWVALLFRLLKELLPLDALALGTCCTSRRLLYLIVILCSLALLVDLNYSQFVFEFVWAVWAIA